MSTETKVLRDALRDLVAVLRARHYGRMPTEVADAFQAAQAALAQSDAQPDTAAQVPIGYVCQRAALVMLRDDVVNLPLHAHKRAIVRAWVEAWIDEVTAEGVAASSPQASPPQPEVSRAHRFGDLLCRLMESEYAGEMADRMHACLLREWQEATDEHVESTAAASPPEAAQPEAAAVPMATVERCACGYPQPCSKTVPFSFCRQPVK